jgi:hypothetical protein
MKKVVKTLQTIWAAYVWLSAQSTLNARDPRADRSQIGRLPYLFEIGFQKIGVIPCMAIWELVRYDTVWSGTWRSCASSSNAGMIPAAVKVVMNAKEYTSARFMFFFDKLVTHLC